MFNIQYTYSLLTLMALLTLSSLAVAQPPSTLPSPTASLNTTSPRHPSVAIKSNLLYLTALVPNAEVELYITKHSSIAFEMQAAWWDSFHKGFFYRLLAASPEIRYWFASNRRFKGHYVGIYAGAGLYDFMIRSSDIGHQGNFWHAGASYGYIYPLNQHLAIELGIGAGWLETKYTSYKRCNNDCYAKTSRKRTSWLGPTKAEITLVWTLGTKGGR